MNATVVPAIEMRRDNVMLPVKAYDIIVPLTKATVLHITAFSNVLLIVSFIIYYGGPAVLSTH
jgi:hypothetical protein